MRRLAIDQEEIKRLLEYRDGALFWRIKKAKRSKYRARAGCLGSRYRVIGINGINYMEHRLIYTMHYGEIPKNMVVDHIDRDHQNNRIENLRLATTSQNTLNSKVYCTNKSGFRGVFFLREDKVWIASLKVNERIIYLGRFKTKEMAIQVYEKAANEHCGDFKGELISQSKTQSSV